MKNIRLFVILPHLQNIWKDEGVGGEITGGSRRKRPQQPLDFYERDGSAAPLQL